MARARLLVPKKTTEQTMQRRKNMKKKKRTRSEIENQSQDLKTKQVKIAASSTPVYAADDVEKLNKKKEKVKETIVLVKEEKVGARLAQAEEDEDDDDDESKSKISRDLRDHFLKNGFDYRWADEKDLEDMDRKWIAYKIAEAQSDLAENDFRIAFNMCALKAYRAFGT